MRLDPAKHAWIKAPETQAVMAALGEARFVGGAVRNALLGVPVSDIDIAVPFDPQEAQRRLEQGGIKVVPTGIDHGTVTAIVNDKLFEVTSLRRDVETDGRHAVVAYTSDWEADSARRDFTLNALYASADGEVFDYHDGAQDLFAGRVRFVGEAAQRIGEDYLRILRLFRFHAWYGKGEIDGEALRAAAAAKNHLARLSGERIAKELLRLLEASNPVPVLRVMAASGVLGELLPGALQLGRLEHLVAIDADNLYPPDAMLRLAALLPDNVAAARTVSERLKLSGAARQRLEDLAGAGVLVTAPAQAVHKALYRLGAGRFRDRVRLAWAASPKEARPIVWRMLLEIAHDWERPKFPLNGSDVMAAGVPQGPAVGRILDEVEEWWLDNDFPAEGAVREKLSAMIAAGAYR